MKYNNVQLLSVKSFNHKVRSTLSIKMWEEQKKMQVLGRGDIWSTLVVEFTWRCATCRAVGARERENEDRRVSYTIQKPIRVDPDVGQDLTAHRPSTADAVVDASGCFPWAVGCCSNIVRLHCYDSIRWREAAEAGLYRKENLPHNCDDLNCFHDLLVKRKTKQEKFS